MRGATVSGDGRSAVIETAGGRRRLIIKDQVEDVDYSDQKVDYVAVTASRLRRCRFERLRLVEAALSGGGVVSEYVDCSFDGSQFTIVLPGSARFTRCTFRQVTINEWLGDQAELIDCVFTGTIKKTVFWGRQWGEGPGRVESLRALREKQGLPPMTPEQEAVLLRESNEFRGNDFSGATLRGVSFRGGIDLAAQRLPAGPDYLLLSYAAHAIAHAVEAVTGWPDDERRKLGHRLLNVIASELKHGQSQVLICRKDYPRHKSVVDDVFAELRQQDLSA
jgi:uncharacterized protein YjbI with pentapeptide repeats